MLLRLSTFSALVLFAGACRIANGPASVKDVAPAATVAPVLLLEGGMGSAANAVYDATKLAEANDGSAVRKSHLGRVRLRCTEGASSPQAYACTAEGKPAQAILQVSEDSAQALWKAFGTVARLTTGGGYEKELSLDEAEYACAKAGAKYRCTVGAPGSGAARLTGPNTGGREVMSLLGGKGSVAGVVFRAMVTRETTVGGVATKSVTGRVAVACEQTSRLFTCTGRVPTAPAPFLKIEGEAATAFAEALRTPGKAFGTEAGELTCTRGGNETYSCTLRGT